MFELSFLIAFAFGIFFTECEAFSQHYTTNLYLVA